MELRGSFFNNSTIRIRGSHNHFVIEEGCNIGEGCSFWLEGNGNEIHVGRNTTMTSKCHLNAQEHNTKIIIGEDCMFSNTIVIRTSDSHPIFGSDGKRLNEAKDVIIGNHVWIAPNSIVMKGASIGNGVIIGQYTMVNKPIPDCCIAVGMPAKVVKRDIRWSRDNVLK